MKNNDLIQLAKQEYQDKTLIKQRLDDYYLKEQTKNGLKDLEKIKAYLPGKYQLLGMRRGFVIAHLDLEPILELMANGEEFTVVSGLNPSSPLHFGHKNLFDLLIELQNFGANIHIPITNDESYLDDKTNSLKESREKAFNEVIPSILSFGFEQGRTKLYALSDYPQIYNLAMLISKHVSLSQLETVFGKESLNNVGQIFYRGSVQLAQILLPQLPEFGGPKHTLIPVGIDQHPYILLARDVAKKLGMIPPSELVIKFQQSLLNPEEKMSGSKPNTAIYLSDDEETIKKKINRAYTGSVSVLSVHQELGGIPEICSVFSLLNNNHPDDEFIINLYQRYEKGELGMQELKKIATDFVTQEVKKYQNKQKNIKQFILEKPLRSFL